MEIRLLVAEDQVGLADDPDHVPLLVGDGDRPLLRLREELDGVAGVRVGRHRGHVRSMISAAVVIVGCEVIGPARYPGRRPAGIESITSVAIVDSAAPIRSAASLPARAWARTPRRRPRTARARGRAARR